MRNIMREIEFFAPAQYLIVGWAGYAFNVSLVHWSFILITLIWIVVLLIVPWRSRYNQRFGDMLANTAVINDPKPVLMRDFATVNTHRDRINEERFIFQTHHLDQYGRYELQVLEKVLRGADKSVTVGSQLSKEKYLAEICLLYTSPSPRDKRQSRMPSSA